MQRGWSSPLVLSSRNSCHCLGGTQVITYPSRPGPVFLISVDQVFLVTQFDLATEEVIRRGNGDICMHICGKYSIIITMLVVKTFKI